MSSPRERSRGVFIGWAGERSGYIAQALRSWLECLSLDVQPWLSSLDLAKGVVWWEELQRQLKSSAAGILCLTPDNKDSPWLHFEAGALARSVKRKLVIPFAIDMIP